MIGVGGMWDDGRDGDGDGSLEASTGWDGRATLMMMGEVGVMAHASPAESCA